MIRLAYIILLGFLLHVDMFSQEISSEDTNRCSVYLKFKEKDLQTEEYLCAWRFLIQNCPSASKLTYIYGEKYFKELIDLEKDQVQREKYIDTLMINYDMRMKYLGDSSKVLYRKATSILRYRRTEFKLAYDYINQSIEMAPQESPMKYSIFMVLSKVMLEKEMITYSDYQQNLNYTYKQLEIYSTENPDAELYYIYDALEKLE